jgi:hypothetical protein
VRSAIRRSTRSILHDILRGDVKRLRKSLVENRSRDIRRVELQVVSLVGEQAQNVNFIFDLLVFHDFFSTTDKV